MKINKKQLISLLAERADMDRKEVDEQLEALIGRIRQVEEDENSFHIEGFGTFTAVQDRLEFSPTDVFETEINNRYAGMKPIELIGAYKVPESLEKLPAADPEEEKLAKASSHITSEEAKKDETAAATEDQTYAGDDTEPSEEEVVQAKHDESAEKAVDPVPSEGDTSKEEVDARKPAPEKSKEAYKPKSAQDDDPIGKAMLIMLIALLLAAAAWFAYDFGLFSAEQGAEQAPVQESPAEQQTEDEQPDGTADIPAQGGAELPIDNETVSSTSAGNENNDTSVEQEPYGLYGEFNAGLEGRYFTIVIHSLRTRELAEEKVQEVDDQNFRIKIKQTTVNGSTYYRVGIGQFKTVDAAQEAVSELPEPLKSNNFINLF